MFEEKKVFWQFEVEGQEDYIMDKQRSINESLTDFTENSVAVKKGVAMVCFVMVIDNK